MYAVITIAIESKEWQLVPVPGCPSRAIAEILEMIRMNVEKNGGSVRVTETIIRESK